MNLNRKNFVELFNADFQVVMVTFNDTKSHLPSYGRVYAYKAPLNIKIENGDTLVVLSPNNELKQVTCVLVHQNPDGADIDSDPFKLKWIVGRFDDVMRQHTECTQRDTELRKSVGILERALERVQLHEQLKLAFKTLPQSEIDRLMPLMAPEIKSLMQVNDGREHG